MFIIKNTKLEVAGTCALIYKMSGRDPAIEIGIDNLGRAFGTYKKNDNDLKWVIKPGNECLPHHIYMLAQQFLEAEEKELLFFEFLIDNHFMRNKMIFSDDKIIF